MVSTSLGTLTLNGLILSPLELETLAPISQKSLILKYLLSNLQYLDKCYKRPSEYYLMRCKVTWKSFCTSFLPIKLKFGSMGMSGLVAEVYSEPCQTSKIERFAKMVNG